MELEGNSNSGTSAAFLEQLRERHHGRLNVIWDNAPAPLRQAQEGRGGERTAEKPWAEPAIDKPARLQPGLQRRRGHLGVGEGGSHRQSVLGKQGGGAGESRQFPVRAGPPERRGETTLPDSAAIKAEALLRDSLSDPTTQQMHVPLWLWFSRSLTNACRRWKRGRYLAELPHAATTLLHSLASRCRWLSFSGPTGSRWSTRPLGSVNLRANKLPTTIPPWPHLAAKVMHRRMVASSMVASALLGLSMMNSMRSLVSSQIRCSV